MTEQPALRGGATSPAGAQELTVRRVSGTPAQVKARLASYQRRGMLGEVGRAFRMPGEQGKVFVDICLIEVEQASSWTPRRKILVITAAALVVLLALGWSLFMLASAAAAAATSAVPVLLLAGAAVIGVRRLARPRGGCTTHVQVTHRH